MHSKEDSGTRYVSTYLRLVYHVGPQQVLHSQPDQSRRKVGWRVSQMLGQERRMWSIKEPAEVMGEETAEMGRNEEAALWGAQRRGCRAEQG